MRPNPIALAMLGGNFSPGRRSGAAGWYCKRSCGSCWYGSGGRLCGSCSCAKVAAVPGAVGPAVKAWRAADNSPCWTRCRARSRRLASLLLLVSMSGLGCCVQVLAVAKLAPVALLEAGARHVGLGRCRVPASLWGSIRGNRTHNFHARVDFASVSIWQMQSKARYEGWRGGEHKGFLPQSAHYVDRIELLQNLSELAVGEPGGRGSWRVGCGWCVVGPVVGLLGLPLGQVGRSWHCWILGWGCC